MDTSQLGPKRKASFKNSVSSLASDSGASGKSTTPQKFAKGGLALSGGTLKNTTGHGKAQAFSGKLMKQKPAPKVPKRMGAKMGSKKAPNGL